MTTRAPCNLCCQIAGDPGGDLIAGMLPGEPYVRRVVSESPSFAVIPSLGPLADGHVILCTKEHTRSLATLSAGLEGEYAQLKTAVAATLCSFYGAPVHAFEHGMAATGDRVPCSVDHMHVHMVPLAADVRPALPGHAQWISIDGSLASLAASTGGGEYLLYEPPSGETLVAVAGDEPFESQCMRRALAEALGHASWNWRDGPDPWAAHRAWELLRAR